MSGRQLTKWVVLLCTLLLAACKDRPCVDADDWGYPKVTVPSSTADIASITKKPIVGDNQYQEAPAIDSGQVLIGGNNVLIASIQEGGRWSSWWGKAETTQRSGLNVLRTKTSFSSYSEEDVPNRSCMYFRANGALYNSVSDPIPLSPSTGTAADGVTLAKANHRNVCPNLPNEIKQTVQVPNPAYLGADGNTFEPDYYSDCMVPCWMQNGMGLYVGLADANGSEEDVNYSRHIPDANQPYLVRVIDRQNDGYLLRGITNAVLPSATGLDRSGAFSPDRWDRLYFKIIDRHYDDNQGEYRVLLKQGTRSPKLGPIEKIVNFFKDPVLNAMERIYRSIVANENYVNGVRALLMMFIIIYGYNILMGSVRRHNAMRESTILCVKLSLVVILISEESYDFFYNYFFVVFLEGVDSFALTFLSLGDFAQFDPDAPWYTVDDVLRKFFSGATSAKIFSTLFSNPAGFIFIAILYLSIILFLIALTRAIMAYLVAVFLMAVLVIVAPVFLLFLLFNATKSFFFEWFSQFIAYSIQMILMFAAVGMFLLVITESMEQILGYRTCWKSWFSIDLLGLDIDLKFWMPDNREILGWVPFDANDDGTIDWTANVGSGGGGMTAIQPDLGVEPEFYFNADDYNAAIHPEGGVRFIDLPYFDPTNADDLDKIRDYLSDKSFLRLGDALMLLAAVFIMQQFMKFVPTLAGALKGGGGKEDFGSIFNGSGDSVAAFRRAVFGREMSESKKLAMQSKNRRTRRFVARKGGIVGALAGGVDRFGDGVNFAKSTSNKVGKVINKRRNNKKSEELLLEEYGFDAEEKLSTTMYSTEFGMLTELEKMKEKNQWLNGGGSYEDWKNGKANFAKFDYENKSALNETERQILIRSKNLDPSLASKIQDGLDSDSFNRRDLRLIKNSLAEKEGVSEELKRDINEGIKRIDFRNKRRAALKRSFYSRDASVSKKIVNSYKGDVVTLQNDLSFLENLIPEAQKRLFAAKSQRLVKLSSETSNYSNRDRIRDMEKNLITQRTSLTADQKNVMKNQVVKGRFKADIEDALLEYNLNSGDERSFTLEDFDSSFENDPRFKRLVESDPLLKVRVQQAQTKRITKNSELNDNVIQLQAPRANARLKRNEVLERVELNRKELTELGLARAVVMTDENGKETIKYIATSEATDADKLLLRRLELQDNLARDNFSLIQRKDKNNNIISNSLAGNRRKMQSDIDKLKAQEVVLRASENGDIDENQSEKLLKIIELKDQVYNKQGVLGGARSYLLEAKNKKEIAQLQLDLKQGILGLEKEELEKLEALEAEIERLEEEEKKLKEQQAELERTKEAEEERLSKEESDRIKEELNKLKEAQVKALEELRVLKEKESMLAEEEGLIEIEREKIEREYKRQVLMAQSWMPQMAARQFDADARKVEIDKELKALNANKEIDKKEKDIKKNILDTERVLADRDARGILTMIPRPVGRKALERRLKRDQERLQANVDSQALKQERQDLEAKLKVTSNKSERERIEKAIKAAKFNESAERTKARKRYLRAALQTKDALLRNKYRAERNQIESEGLSVAEEASRFEIFAQKQKLERTKAWAKRNKGVKEGWFSVGNRQRQAAVDRDKAELKILELSEKSGLTTAELRDLSSKRRNSLLDEKARETKAALEAKTTLSEKELRELDAAFVERQRSRRMARKYFKGTRDRVGSLKAGSWMADNNRIDYKLEQDVKRAREKVKNQEMQDKGLINQSTRDKLDTLSDKERFDGLRKNYNRFSTPGSMFYKQRNTAKDRQDSMDGIYEDLRNEGKISQREYELQKLRNEAVRNLEVVGTNQQDTLNMKRKAQRQIALFDTLVDIQKQREKLSQGFYIDEGGKKVTISKEEAQIREKILRKKEDQALRRAGRFAKRDDDGQVELSDAGRFSRAFGNDFRVNLGDSRNMLGSTVDWTKSNREKDFNKDIERLRKLEEEYKDYIPYNERTRFEEEEESRGSSGGYSGGGFDGDSDSGSSGYSSGGYGGGGSSDDEEYDDFDDEWEEMLQGSAGNESNTDESEGDEGNRSNPASGFFGRASDEEEESENRDSGGESLTIDDNDVELRELRNQIEAKRLELSSAMNNDQTEYARKLLSEMNDLESRLEELGETAPSIDVNIDPVLSDTQHKVQDLDKARQDALESGDRRKATEITKEIDRIIQSKINKLREEQNEGSEESSDSQERERQIEELKKAAQSNQSKSFLGNVNNARQQSARDRYDAAKNELNKIEQKISDLKLALQGAESQEEKERISRELSDARNNRDGLKTERSQARKRLRNIQGDV